MTLKIRGMFHNPKNKQLKSQWMWGKLNRIQTVKNEPVL